MKNVTKNKHAGMLRVLFVMAAVLLLAAACVGAASAWGGGSGTAEDPYVITTSDDLVLAGHDANERYYVLGNSITLTEQVSVTKNVTINGAGYTVDVDGGFNTANYIFHVSRQNGEAGNARLNLSNIILECGNLARGINFITFNDPTPASKNVLTNVVIHNSRASGINMNHGVYLEASGLTINGSRYTISIDIDSKDLTATDKNVLVLTDGDSGLKDAIKVKDESAVSGNLNNSVYRIGSVEQTPNAYLKHTTGAGDTDYTGVAWVNEEKVNAGLSENAAKIVEDDKLYLYKTLPEAVGYNTGSETIELLKNIVLDGECGISTSQTLNLAGHTITAKSNTNLIWVHNNAVFTLNDSVGGGQLIGNGKVNDNGPCVYVGFGDSDAGTFIMNGGTITNGWANKRGGGVYLTASDSAFIMNGGTIRDCKATGTQGDDGGGGVYVKNGCTFTMNGGNITNCTATTYGGGVYSRDTFKMYGGSSIEDCKAANGGGLCVDTSAFTMYGGSITGCTADSNGGGINLYGGTFTMEGGSISGCSAAQGSGVFIYYQDDEYFGTFIMNGTAVIDAGNDVFLGGNTTDYHFITNITLGAGGFTAAGAGVKNITLQDGAAAWEGKTIVKNGAGNKSNFALSLAYAGYELKAGTIDQANDLVLAELQINLPIVTIDLSVGEQTKEHGTYTGYVYLNPAEGETDLTGWNLTGFSFALKGDKVTLSNYEYGRGLTNGWLITPNENRVSAVCSKVGGTPLTGKTKVELARFTINTSALSADETGANISFIDEVSGMYVLLINTTAGKDAKLDISGERTLSNATPNSIIKNSTAPAWLETESTINVNDAFTVLNEIGWRITEGYNTSYSASPADALEIVTISDEKYCLALKGTGAGNLTAVLNTTDDTFIATKDAAFTLRENATLPTENGQSIVAFNGSSYRYTGQNLTAEIKKNITIINHTVCAEHPEGIPRELNYTLHFFSVTDAANETYPVAAGDYTFRVGISGEPGYYANTQTLNDTAYTFTIVAGIVDSIVTVNNDTAKPGHFNATAPAVITVTYTVNPAFASTTTLNSTDNIGNFSNGGKLNIALPYNQTISEQQNKLTYGTNYSYAYPKLTINSDTHPVNGKTTTEFYFIGRLLGDVNNDNNVNLGDAIKVAQNINPNSLSVEDTFYGQIYSTGTKLSINDAVGIAKYNVHLVNADYLAVT